MTLHTIDICLVYNIGWRLLWLVFLCSYSVVLMVVYVLIVQEIFGPVLTVYVYEDHDAVDVLKLVDTTTQFALTGAIFADDEYVLF